MNDKQRVAVMWEHLMELKGFQDRVARIEAAEDLRNRRAEALRIKMSEKGAFPAMPPSQQAAAIAKLRAEVEAEVR